MISILELYDAASKERQRVLEKEKSSIVINQVRFNYTRPAGPPQVILEPHQVKSTHRDAEQSLVEKEQAFILSFLSDLERYLNPTLSEQKKASIRTRVKQLCENVLFGYREFSQGKTAELRESHIEMGGYLTGLDEGGGIRELPHQIKFAAFWKWKFNRLHEQHLNRFSGNSPSNK